MVSSPAARVAAARTTLGSPTEAGTTPCTARGPGKSQRPRAPRLARRAGLLVPRLPARRPSGTGPDRRSRRAARRWRCAIRHRQLRGAVPVVQLDEGRGGRRPGPHTPIRPSWTTAPGDCVYAAEFRELSRSPIGDPPSSPVRAHVGPRGAMTASVAPQCHPTGEARGGAQGPTPVGRVVGVPRSSVGLRAGHRHDPLCGWLALRPDRLRCLDRLLLGRCHLGGLPCARGREQLIPADGLRAGLAVPSLGLEVAAGSELALAPTGLAVRRRLPSRPADSQRRARQPPVAATTRPVRSLWGRSSRRAVLGAVRRRRR